MSNEAQNIDENSYIGPGAKIYGSINIEFNIKISGDSAEINSKNIKNLDKLNLRLLCSKKLMN